MSLLNKNGGMINVIRCDEPSYLIWKWHPAGTEEGKNSRENAIRFGSMLRVKDGEVAVFVYNQDNIIMQDYIVGPFDQKLETSNFPVLAKIRGLAYGGDTPFQAEVYFVNMAKVIQTRFAVPYFDVFDPRFGDFGVPVAVRGTMTFKIDNALEFIKLHRLTTFTIDDFQRQVKDAVTRYVKNVVANAPSEYNIPLVQIEAKTEQITSIIEDKMSERLKETFGVCISAFDIGVIDIDKTSDGYQELIAVTKDLTYATAKAQAEINIKNMYERQAIESQNYQESLRIQREESQFAQHMQTQTANIGTYQIEKQSEVGIAAANALGQMGANGTGSVNLDSGNGIGFNPAAMMAGMAVGGAVGQNLAGTMNGILSGMPSQSSMTPPPIPESLYNVVINGQSAGPYSIAALSQMAQAGQIVSSTLVWKPGMANWAAISTIAELVPVIGSIPPQI